MTLVLAAGASRRLGEPKALVRFAGLTLLESRIRLASAATGQPVFVALGHDADALQPLALDAGSVPLHCSDWEQGMGRTLAQASEQLAARQALTNGLLVLAVDQYRLQADDLTLLLQAFLAAPTQPAAARYAGTLGLPVIFPAGTCSILDSLPASRGAKDWLLRQTALSRVDIDRAAWDLDTTQDLATLRAADH